MRVIEIGSPDWQDGRQRLYKIGGVAGQHTDNPSIKHEFIAIDADPDTVREELHRFRDGENHSPAPVKDPQLFIDHLRKEGYDVISFMNPPTVFHTLEHDEEDPKLSQTPTEDDG